MRRQVNFDEVFTTFKLHDIRDSATLGCHLCAMFQLALPVDVSDGHTSVALDVWDVYFIIGRSNTESALFSLKPVIRNPTLGLYNGSQLLVYPRDHQEYGHPSVLVPDFSKLSLGMSTGDDETFSVARGWLNQCLKEHPLCRERDDEARVVRPARLLSLDRKIKLIDSAEANGEAFVTLSHCWGRQTYVPRLLNETEAVFRQEIELKDLPKTFQDAVVITRNLGYKYIWIDSLCIIQDSPEDWEAQAKIMALVYANSAFTIAALKSTGSSGGCFMDNRNPLGLRPLYLNGMGLSVMHSITDQFWNQEVASSGHSASPLHSRAWVFQERLSSPRTLLYGTRGIFWECRCSQASESHYKTVSWDSLQNKKTWLQKLEIGLNEIFNNPLSDSCRLAFQMRWSDLLREYSGCDLTVKTDKIIAVAGLISEIERRVKFQARCILGLWSHDLPSMALWYRSRNDSNDPSEIMGRLWNRMPTWTWASVEGRCAYMTPPGNVEWQTSIEIDEETIPAAMTINTWRRKVLLTTDDDIILDPDDPRGRERGWGGDLEEEYTWYPDCELPDREALLFVVMIERARICESPLIWVARCLVVTPNIDGADIDGMATFTRVGLAKIRFSEPEDDPFKFNDHGARGRMVLI